MATISSTAAVSTSRCIHQLVHTLSYGDAISTEVIALQRAFIEAGCSSVIFAINVHPHFKGNKSPAAGPIKHYSELPERCLPNQEATIVLHYSLGSPLNDLYRSLVGYQRKLIYHNLTPAHYFEGVNPKLVDHLTAGTAELPALCDLSDELIADSSFNAEDLKRVSQRARERGVQVLPLLVEPSRWTEPANPGFAALLRGTRGANVLHVGRLVPNKSYEQIIRTFYFLRNHIDKHARLWLVGTDIDSELYGFALKRMCDAWGLGSCVEFLGQRSDGEVRALYENCSVYLCLSEHEGFCLPVIEAMHFGLPVISTRSGALAETIGDGGILIDQGASPAMIAELIAEVAHNVELRQQLINAGRARVANYEPQTFSGAVDKLFGLSSAPSEQSLAQGNR